jgi:pyruvate,water dikinase
VKKAYENVFLESALILGASGERLLTLKRHYAQLIGSVDHHLYYDLEHYYAVLRSLPGGDKNIDDWHRMIGGKLNGAAVPYHQTKLSILETIQAMASLAALAVRSRWLYPDFLNSLEHFSKTIETRISSLKEVHEIIDYQRELLSRPMGFGLTVANDVFIMMGLGFLTKRIKARGYSETLIIELLRTHGELDSVKPLNALKNLVNKLPVSFIDELKALKLKPGSEPYRMAFERLNSRWPVEIKAMEHFLNHFGERSFEELKLESLPIKNDPELFLRLISWEGGAHERVMHTEKLPQISFNWLELKVIRFTRSCIEFRESSRLWRGRFYHFLRNLVILMAERLMQTHPAFSSIDLKDFFSLTVDEWSDFLNGKRSEVDVLQLMEGRRKWRVPNQKFPEFLIWTEDEAIMRNVPHKTTEDRLQGLGVSPGVVDGLALVLDNPVDAIGLDLNQYILVTKNTDPAWVYVMSRSRGLISEKGSLLSHTAIIGRELSIPTCVGVKGATEVLKTGDRIRINGTTGEIERT